MKELTLEIKLFKNQKSTIHLGNCDWLHFKSQTYLKDYLRRYKKVLTDNIKILNNYQIQVNTLYRTFYFSLDKITSLKVENYLNEFNHSFNLIFKSFSSGNQNAFTFSNIEKSISNLSDASYTLKQFAAKHKNYALKSNSNMLLKMISDLEQNLEKDKRDLNINRRYADVRMEIVNQKSQTA